jgi:hypothetical protein
VPGASAPCAAFTLRDICERILVSVFDQIDTYSESTSENLLRKTIDAIEMGPIEIYLDTRASFEMIEAVTFFEKSAPDK